MVLNHLSKFYLYHLQNICSRTNVNIAINRVGKIVLDTGIFNLFLNEIKAGSWIVEILKVNFS